MIAKAEKIDGSGEVEGKQLTIQNKTYILKELEDYSILSFEYGETLVEELFDFDEINPQTLKYSFDGGESWYSEEEIQQILSNYEKLADNILNIEVIFNGNSNGADSTECPLCNADGIVEYKSGKIIKQDGMNDIEHDYDCPYRLATQG